MQNYIGQQIDRYRITERLGMGGMAIIYKAYDTRLQREVAIKLIRTQAIPAQQHEHLLKRFEREAKAQAQFNHPHIVPVYDYGVHEGSPYLVMEYIPGGTLKDRITGPVDYKQAVAWVLPIADALGYAHAHGIVHRDVKPSNILINQDNQPILTDFGIAKIMENTEGTLTGTGMGVGTPEYMAPEQWRGESTEASDQYALGVVLYELLTGQKPFTAETPVAIALKQMKDPLTQPSQLVPGISEAVEKVIFKTLAKNPKDRYESMGAFHQALAGTISREGISLRSAEKGELSLKGHAASTKDQGERTSHRKRGWVWGLGVLGVVAGTLFVVMSVVGGNGLGLGRKAINEAGGGEDVLAVGGGTVTSTSQPTVTVTVAPSTTSTLTPTMTPTSESHHLINFIGEDALWQYDLYEGESNFVMELVPHEVEHSYHSNFLEWESYLWSDDGIFLVYAPRFSSRFGSDDVFKGLYLYDVSQKSETGISDKISDYEVKSFSPNGEFIFFYSGMDGTPGLYLYDVSDQILSKIMYLTEKLYINDISWDDESSEVHFCLYKSGGFSSNCYDYKINNGLVENAEDTYNYFDEFDFVWEYIDDSDKQYRPAFWLDTSTAIMLWDDQVDEGYLLIDLDGKTGEYISGPEYEGIKYSDSIFVGDYVVLEPWFGNCFFLFEIDGFKLVNKYCVNQDMFGEKIRDAVQISADNKLLFLFNQNQITSIDLESFEVSTVNLRNIFIAPKVYKN